MKGKGVTKGELEEEVRRGWVGGVPRRGRGGGWGGGWSRMAEHYGGGRGH